MSNQYKQHTNPEPDDLARQLAAELPPISVAAYIYVLNIVGTEGDRTLNIGKDLLIETAIGTISFVLITLLLLGQYQLLSLLFKK